MRHEACNGLYKLSLSGLEGGDSINRSFLLLAASTLLKFLPDAQALKPLRVSLHHPTPPPSRAQNTHERALLLSHTHSGELDCSTHTHTHNTGNTGTPLRLKWILEA